MKSYRIPRNFAKAGNVGRFPRRNVIEACLTVGLILVVLRYLSIPVYPKILIGIFFVVIDVMVTLDGIQDETPVEMIISAVTFRFCRRSYGEPSDRQRAEREKRIIKKKQQQLKEIRIEKAAEEKKRAEAAKLAEREQKKPKRVNRSRKRRKGPEIGDLAHSERFEENGQEDGYGQGK